MTREGGAPRIGGDTGSRPAAGTRVTVVVARWNESITRRLLEGARATLVAGGIEAAAIDEVWVPGSFELPLAADRLAATGRYAAVLCLGAIIRGETVHDRIIAAAVAAGIEQAGRVHGVPILFGVLTCETQAQAEARAGAAPENNKGAESAAAALEMIALLSRLSSTP